MLHFRQLLLLTALLLLLQSATPTSAARTLAWILFSPWPNLPRSWTKYNESALSGSGLKFQPTRNTDKAFSHSLLAASFSYHFYAPMPGRYRLRIGAIEKNGCVPERRVFAFVANNASPPPFSVATRAGCDAPYFADLHIRVRADLLINVSFQQIPGKWAASISNLQLFARSDADPSPTPPATSDINIVHNVRPSFPIAGTKGARYLGAVDVSRARGVSANIFKSSRHGTDFLLRFDLPPGGYDVELGFAQFSSCSAGKNVFNVWIGGFPRLEAFDVFRVAGGCRRALVERFVEQTVDALNPEPFLIEFQAVAGMASLSFLRIRASRSQCTPVTGNPMILADHLAHAIPGTYPQGRESSFVDRSGAGVVRVRIDGSSSHTHFSYRGKSGRIISYRWTNPETGKVFSNTAKFKGTFPLGTTRLKLSVMDNACSRDEAETSVTVTGNMQPGLYCYYYEGLTRMPEAGSLLDGVPPQFAAIQSSAVFGFPSFPFYDTAFVARCIFSVNYEKAWDRSRVSVRTFNTGQVRIYQGADLILDSKTSSRSGPFLTSTGVSAYELIYQHTNTSKNPRLVFKVNGKIPKNVWHDQNSVMPIITSISPSKGRIEGGSRTKITGYGLFRPLKVKMGTQVRAAEREGATSQEVFVISPPVSEPQTVQLTVKSGTGSVSNDLPYSYSNDCDDVRFEKKLIKTSSGGHVPLTQPTSVALGSDGNLYFGTRLGIVQVVSYNADTLVSKSFCYSERLYDSRYKMATGTLSDRSILGIAVDPRDKAARPYVSVGTFFWQRHGNIDPDNKQAWSNGAVERFKPATAETRARDPNQCLEHDKNIVRNLPVSDGDHSVNEILFTQHGDLLIAVGGFTNTGLPFGALGGNWETYFSGAVVLAELSKGKSFNGEIPYTTPENLRTAVPKDGYKDVHLYATGVRNLFTLEMARTGKIYGLDMGPNCKYGNASSSCDEYNEIEAEMRSTSTFVPFPGKAITGPTGECQYGDGRPDKLLEIKEGKYYGHANLQRAAHTGEHGECQWVDPKTNRTPPPFDKKPVRNYEPPLAMVKSPKTGLREYGGNHFCGQMRGDLILSQINNRGVWRTKLDEDGTLNGSPFMFFRNGGIRVEENAHGDLLFPKYYAYPSPGLFVMRPRTSGVRRGVFAANAVPFRHGRQGGTLLTVGGWGFGAGTVVKVGNHQCHVTLVSETEVLCVVPGLSGRNKSADVTVTMGSEESLLRNAVLYMDV